MKKEKEQVFGEFLNILLEENREYKNRKHEKFNYNIALPSFTQWCSFKQLSIMCGRNK